MWFLSTAFTTFRRVSGGSARAYAIHSRTQVVDAPLNPGQLTGADSPIRCDADGGNAVNDRRGGGVALPYQTRLPHNTCPPAPNTASVTTALASSRGGILVLLAHLWPGLALGATARTTPAHGRIRPGFAQPPRR